MFPTSNLAAHDTGCPCAWRALFGCRCLLLLAGKSSSLATSSSDSGARNFTRAKTLVWARTTRSSPSWRVPCTSSAILTRRGDRSLSRRLTLTQLRPCASWPKLKRVKPRHQHRVGSTLQCRMCVVAGELDMSHYWSVLKCLRDHGRCLNLRRYFEPTEMYSVDGDGCRLQRFFGLELVYARAF